MDVWISLYVSQLIPWNLNLKPSLDSGHEKHLIFFLLKHY
jgi:hypothetical protein